MTINAIKKATAALDSLKSNSIDIFSVPIPKSDYNLIKQDLLIKIKPIITEIIQKTSLDIQNEQFDERSHVIEEYKRYVELIDSKNEIITIDESDCLYLNQFFTAERDFTFKDQVEIKNINNFDYEKILDYLSQIK
ncbi:hypothetical protein GVAV_002066 [Gurleya vavrai]